MRRQLTLALVATAVTAAAACSSDGPDLSLAPTQTNVTGAYNLTNAGGHTLPYFYGQTATENLAVAADKIILLGDNSWVDTTTYAITELQDGSVTTQQTATAGVYQIGGGQIKFVKTVNGNDAFVGSVTNNTLTVVASNQKYVYTR